MKTNRTLNKIVTMVPPWSLIGAALILLPIFAFVTYRDIDHQKAASRRQLLEKGAALIRSFEAGTRAGMMMRQWGQRHLQRLLMETARQPDIAYLMVTDVEGRILAHSDLEQIDRYHGEDLDLNRVAASATVIHRVVGSPGDSARVFEIYRKFSPTKPPMRRMGGHHERMHAFDEDGGPEGRRGPNMRRFGPRWGDFAENQPEKLIIFVGLDMTEVDKALAADTRHRLFMAAILLLVGFAGVTLLFMAYNYRMTRASLKRIESFSDSLVENLPVGLVSLDARNRVTTVNPEARRILKLHDDRLIGQSAEKALPGQLADALDNSEVSPGGFEKEIDCRVTATGTIAVGVNASAWHDREGVFMGTILLIRDLTEIRALRREIARSQRLASLGSLAAGVAHEIRNPLSSIKGFATYFKDRDASNQTDHETAAIMINEVERLNRVVGQLLELARPVEVLRKPIRLETLLANSTALIKSQAEEKGIQVNVELPQEDLELQADPDRVSQVLLNLYLNAIDAMEPGKGMLTVSARKTAGQPGIRIAVTDNGSGIASRDLPHVFDPYFTSKTTGTGLGLAIVHNIMEAHGGSASAESEPGSGTTFTLFFPKAYEEKTDD